MENKEEQITITKKEYDSLVKDSEFLNALRAVGVDNWGGYSEAYDYLNGEGDYEFMSESDQ